MDENTIKTIKALYNLGALRASDEDIGEFIRHLQNFNANEHIDELLQKFYDAVEKMCDGGCNARDALDDLAAFEKAAADDGLSALGIHIDESAKEKFAKIAEIREKFTEIQKMLADAGNAVGLAKGGTR